MGRILAKLFGPKKPPRDVELKGLRNAWVSPKGEVHPVVDYGHAGYAYNKLGDRDYVLQERGWIRLSSNTWDNTTWVSQDQFDLIFDWKTANGYTFVPSDYVIA